MTLSPHPILLRCDSGTHSNYKSPVSASPVLNVRTCVRDTPSYIHGRWQTSVIVTRSWRTSCSLRFLEADRDRVTLGGQNSSEMEILVILVRVISPRRLDIYTY